MAEVFTAALPNKKPIPEDAPFDAAVAVNAPTGDWHRYNPWPGETAELFALA